MSYVLSSLAFVVAVLGGAWLLGRAVLMRCALVTGDRWSVADLLTLPIGIGVLTIVLFALAALHWLSPLPLLATWLLLLGAALLQIVTAARRQALPGLGPRGGIALLRSHPWQATAALLALTAGALLALSAPLEWDELAYHLPYARDYVQAGGLTVSEDLRFPLQAHNFHLLYAAGLIFGSEAASHLLHASSGALVAAGIYAHACWQGDRLTAVIATGLYLVAAGRLLDTAYVDLGASLFLFHAFLALALWQRGGQPALLLIGSFLLALAIGTRYQTLILLPPFLLAAALAHPAAGLALRALVVLLVFSGYWYLRSWWISGDPLHPLGGPLFGYWLWDAADLAAQHADLARYGDHLPAILWPALLAPLLPSRRDPLQRSLLLLGLLGLLGWYLTSRYERYLLPAWPFLALLSAQVLREALARLPARWRSLARSATARAPTRIAGLALLLAGLAAAVVHDRNEICFTRACVEQVQAQQLLAPGLREEVSEFEQLRLYQFGLEQERYVLGPRVKGDWFGPYRYRNLLALQGDPAAVRRHLEALGADALLINLGREPFAGFAAGTALEEEFETLYADDRVLLLRISAGDR